MASPSAGPASLSHRWGRHGGEQGSLKAPRWGGLGPEPTAGCSEDRRLMPHGQSHRAMGAATGHGQALSSLLGSRVPGTGSAESHQAVPEGHTAPSPQPHPREFIPQLRVHLADGPF